MFQNQTNSLLGAGGGGGAASPNPIAASMDPTQQQHLPQQQQPQAQNMNYNGVQQQQPQQQQQAQASRNIRKKPYVRITEQPASKALRFRYECEGRSAGSIPGVNSTPENKTYPTIEIVGYKGRAVVVVSCVTKDMPYRPHPHNLVGKDGCKKGVCTLEINSETMRAVFSNLGIQCVKKKDIEAALKAREEIRVDPYKTGFSHRFQPTSIDLNSVRLCFQVFMEGEKGRFTQPLAPVVSEPIYDKKAMSDLVICRLCTCSATVLGNTQIILLCEKVAKEDIAVRFFEEKNGQVVWEAYGDFQHTDVHKQTAITFKTPKYHTTDITEPAKVYIQLKRPSDGVTSEPLEFEYVPLESDPVHLKRKRQKTGGDPNYLVLQQQQKLQQRDHRSGSCWAAQNLPAIKTEPRDPSPQPFGLYGMPTEMTPSPQPLSPSNNYNNTNSPYSIAAGRAMPVGNQHLMSPSHHHYHGGGPVGGGGQHVPPATSPMNMPDYNAFSAQQQHPHTSPHAHALHQQHHHHQHQQQQQHSHQQQQYNGNMFGGDNDSPWEEKFAVAMANANVNNNINTNMSNLNSNEFNIQALLAASAAANGMDQHDEWNLPPQEMHNLAMEQQQQQQHMHQHQQQQYQQQQQQQQQHHANDMNMTVASPAADEAETGDQNNINTAGASEQGPTLSNLLNFDSEQLVRINSEDQQMIRLNSEDLQLSNLSIST